MKASDARERLLPDGTASKDGLTFSISNLLAGENAVEPLKLEAVDIGRRVRIVDYGGAAVKRGGGLWASLGPWAGLAIGLGMVTIGSQVFMDRFVEVADADALSMRSTRPNAPPRLL